MKKFLLSLSVLANLMFTLSAPAFAEHGNPEIVDVDVDFDARWDGPRRPDHWDPYPGRPGRPGRPGYPRHAECVAEMVTFRGRVLDVFREFGPDPRFACQRALQRCDYELRRRHHHGHNLQARCEIDRRRPFPHDRDPHYPGWDRPNPYPGPGHDHDHDHR